MFFIPLILQRMTIITIENSTPSKRGYCFDYTQRCLAWNPSLNTYSSIAHTFLPKISSLKIGGRKREKKRPPCSIFWLGQMGSKIFWKFIHICYLGGFNPRVISVVQPVSVLLGVIWRAGCRNAFVWAQWVWRGFRGTETVVCTSIVLYLKQNAPRACRGCSFNNQQWSPWWWWWTPALYQGKMSKNFELQPNLFFFCFFSDKEYMGLVHIVCHWIDSSLYQLLVVGQLSHSTRL